MVFRRLNRRGMILFFGKRYFYPIPDALCICVNYLLTSAPSVHVESFSFRQKFSGIKQFVRGSVFRLPLLAT